MVTLTGEVDDFMQARYAWDDAWESAGVRGVVNNLTVRTDVPRDEMDLPQTAGTERRRGGGRRRTSDRGRCVGAGATRLAPRGRQLEGRVLVCADATRLTRRGLRVGPLRRAPGRPGAPPP